MAKSLLDRVDTSPGFKTWRFCCGMTLLLFLKHINIPIEVKSQISCYNNLLRLLQPSIAESPDRMLYSEEINMLLGDMFDDRFVPK